MLILDALNKYTNEDFYYNSSNDLFWSRSFEVIESENGQYSLSEYDQCHATGIWNEFPVCYNETLADIIDKINEITNNE
jgi:hypothetical protein